MPEPAGGAPLDPASSEGIARAIANARHAPVARAADSVTHDVNNLLGAGSAYAELVALDPGISADSRRMLGEIVSSLGRCAALVSGLTALARKEAILANPEDSAALVRQALLLNAHALRKSKVRVEETYPDGEYTIVCDGPRLQIALLQLLVNAREQLEQIEPQERVVRVSITHEDGHLCFHVWNAGPAVPEAIREAIFAPFFTTKPAPHQGLGLPAVRAAAEMHDGSLTYAPETGFTLRIAQYPAYARALRAARGL